LNFALQVPLSNNGTSLEVMHVPTLLMMHGMTGTASMMHDFAERILPDGWTLLVPEGRYPHPRRGYSWWRYENWNAPPASRKGLTRLELMDVDASLAQLEQEVAHHAPAGPLVVGGFSMGGAMAQEMLQLSLAERIIGVIALGTRLVRPMELRVRLEGLEPKHLFWMHGTRDVRVPIEDGWAVAHLFEAAGWALELIEHEKGHMIPTEHHDAVREWLQAIELDWHGRLQRK
jgi:predicted esterase